MLYLLTTCCTTFPSEPVKPNQNVTLMEPAGWGTGGVGVMVGAWATAVEAARNPVPSIVIKARVSSRHICFACCNVFSPLDVLDYPSRQSLWVSRQGSNALTTAHRS